jgi:oxygen-independent coproporphyrinogen-3 oxidase
MLGKSGGITRISLGTQSFREDRLKFMGRAQRGRKPWRASRSSQGRFRHRGPSTSSTAAGNDLAEWDEQLDIALEHGMPHLSAYCLTVEPAPPWRIK